MLSAAEIAAVRAEHRIADVLARARVDLRELGDASSVMVCCPLPDHDDATPSMIVHLDTDRYHCFGCGAHGDVLQLVMDLEQLTSLTRAAAVLSSRRALRSYPSSRGRARVTGSAAATTARHVALRASTTVERPRLDRTSAARVLEVNAAAWAEVTTPARAETARRYLAGRGIDCAALEEVAGRPVAGCAPASQTGLHDRLRAEGFSMDELVDAGWVSRRENGTSFDRYRGRLLLPARDELDRVVGIYARDLTGRSRARYLNTPDTAVFRKRDVLYRPHVLPLGRDASVVVCEGALDALAIASAAATARRTAQLAPVAPSGTALTTAQVRALLRISDHPPVLCADGDDAGTTAAAKWAAAIIGEHRDCLVVLLPGNADPAEWIARNGPDGLAAFSRLGPGHLSVDGAARPVPPGAHLAAASSASRRELGHGPVGVTAPAIERLAAIGRELPGAGATKRFAIDARRAPATSRPGADDGFTTRTCNVITDADRTVARDRHERTDEGGVAL